MKLGSCCGRLHTAKTLILSFGHWLYHLCATEYMIRISVKKSCGAEEGSLGGGTFLLAQNRNRCDPKPETEHVEPRACLKAYSTPITDANDPKLLLGLFKILQALPHLLTGPFDIFGILWSSVCGIVGLTYSFIRLIWMPHSFTILVRNARGEEKLCGGKYLKNACPVFVDPPIFTAATLAQNEYNGHVSDNHHFLVGESVLSSNSHYIHTSL